MRILYIFRSLAIWGGIERILVDKMNFLVSMYGYDIHMITFDQGSHKVPYELADGVHMEDLDICFHRQYRYRGIRRLIDGYRRRKLFEKRLSERLAVLFPDVIVCVADVHVCSIVKVKGQIPLVVESHNDYNHTFSSQSLRQQYNMWLMKRALRKVQNVVVLTNGDSKVWKQHYPYVSVIPNMVHLNETGLYSDNSNHRVIFVGRFDAQKRVDRVIGIWRMVQSRFPDWHLDIYGEGECQQEIETEVKRLDMNIHIHKPTRNIFDCYRESAFLVLTSSFEPFGLVMPEAMSCGLPVVAFDCPYGPASIITPGKDGFLVPQFDKQAFAERMCQLMENESLRQKMGRVAIHSAQRYSAETIMPMWRGLFENFPLYRL